MAPLSSPAAVYMTHSMLRCRAPPVPCGSQPWSSFLWSSLVSWSYLAGMSVPSWQVGKYAPNSGRFSMASQVFVGRQRELAVLAELAARARADQPQVVLVEGEAGMGKSSLLARFVPAAGGTAVLRASGC
jgi:hypothetical protein